ncbi:MAG: carboxypeptidase regulatory-like domain-containing protein [Holophagales bacterium]|nr:carboxypeptidase regulatory-like domain-containing protein [Holophagales bacterium]
MPRKVLIAVGVALLLLLSIEGPALAQGSLTGSLQGAVKDDQGGPLPGVSVTAASAALVKGKATTVTDSRGGYRFPSLPPGTYLVEAALQGFRNVQQPDVRVGLGQALVIDLTLRLESVKTEVTVTGEAPLVSVVSNEVSNNFGQEFLEKAPLPRNYYAIIKTAPGVNLYGNGSGSSILAYGGTDARQNSYTIDGVNVADSGGGGYWMLPSIQWMDEIQVSGLGANAEYGAYTGGVINGVTKSGGNEVHGGLEVYYQPEEWTADNAPEGYDAEAKFKFTDVAREHRRTARQGQALVLRFRRILAADHDARRRPRLHRSQDPPLPREAHLAAGREHPRLHDGRVRQGDPGAQGHQPVHASRGLLQAGRTQRDVRPQRGAPDQLVELPQPEGHRLRRGTTPFRTTASTPRAASTRTPGTPGSIRTSTTSPTVTT